ncbi:hypothetical protein [Streptomyces albidoflavus]|uniref:hypothetical protein n=1 Tax=Streptomyces albidoflavus TaxID=1886 RepID=UPI003326E81E
MMASGEAFSTVVIGADGTGVVVIGTGTRLQTWTVSQVSVEVPGAPIGATCTLRKGGALITPLIPTGDAATGDPPVIVRPGEALTVEFAGCTPGQTGTVYAIYDDGRPT